MAFKIGNETYNRIYVSNDKNNLQQNLATSLTFGDNNITTFRDSNTFETPSIWAYDERVLSKSNSGVIFLGSSQGKDNYGSISCNYIIRALTANYTTKFISGGGVAEGNSKTISFRMGTSDGFTANNTFENYIYFDINEFKESNMVYTYYTAGWKNSKETTTAINSGRLYAKSAVAYDVERNNSIDINIQNANNEWQIAAKYYLNKGTQEEKTVEQTIVSEQIFDVSVGNISIHSVAPKITGEVGLWIYLSTNLKGQPALNCNINCNTDYNIPKQ